MNSIKALLAGLSFLALASVGFTVADQMTTDTATHADNSTMVQTAKTHGASDVKSTTTALPTDKLTASTHNASFAQPKASKPAVKLCRIEEGTRDLVQGSGSVHSWSWEPCNG